MRDSVKDVSSVTNSNNSVLFSKSKGKLIMKKKKNNFLIAPDISIYDFNLIKVLGRGAFGKVRMI